MNAHSEHLIHKQVTEEEGIQLQKQAKEFLAQQAKSKQEFDQSKNLIYYLVSSRFIKQWLKYCMATTTTRLYPSPMNADLVAKGTQDLRSGLIENHDFQILSITEYSMLNWKQIAAQFRRLAYFDQHGSKRVPIYSQSINYVIINRTHVDKIKSSLLNIDEFKSKFKTIKIFGPNHSIQQFLKHLPDLQKDSVTYKSRVWVVQNGLRQGQVFRLLSDQLTKTFSSDRIKGIGDVIEDEETELQKLQLNQDKFLIVQSIKYDRWIFKLPNQARCSNCFKIKPIIIVCPCKKVSYCSEYCEQKEEMYHILRCSFAIQQEKNRKIIMKKQKNCLKGLVGLNNLGNTCFMNSCLQCLSHTIPLTDYFLEGNFESEINTANVLGSGGKLAKAYALFIKSMWYESNSSISPYKLKSAVASINQIFAGYDQHDSQQFLTFLVDGLKEDLCRVRKKPYIQQIDNNGKPECEIAQLSWLNYIKRNYSIITDLMVGQYRSKVTCPTCNLESITFDPFNTVTLPIPDEKKMLQLQYFVIFKDHQQETKKMSIFYTKMNPDLWLEEATKNLKRQKKDFQFYFLTYHEDIYPLAKLSNQQFVQLYHTEKKNLFLLEIGLEEQQISNRLEIPVRITKPIYGSNQTKWFRRPFYFYYDTVTGQSIYRRMLRYFYYSIYPKNVKKQSDYSFGACGQPYESYQAAMLQNRPFQIFIRHGKETRNFTSKQTIKYKNEIVIHDQNKLKDILVGHVLDDIQLEVRFNSYGDEQFKLENLTHFENCIKSNNKYGNTQKKSVTLNDCFEALEEKEQLGKGNQWYCPRCKLHKLATKQLSIYKAPDILILHFKRFKSRGHYLKQKNQTPVQFPHQLDVSSYVIDHLPMSSYNQYLKEKGISEQLRFQLKTNQNPSPIYELYAISNHMGGLGGGHYTAFAKNDGKWYAFNDSSVTNISQQQIQLKKSNAYMVFYRRKN